jgi:N6-adenosine-specific RNA methylase IME4/ParB-like chromosome segregation protein Spo0J
MELDLTEIRTDGGTQPRAQLDGVTVSEYADAMRRGNDFPPVKVMHDGENYWLYDGFHRVQAARQIGRETIKADVEQGTKEDAQWASLAANKRHGLRRSQKDKRRAIKRALKMRGADNSNRDIAKHVGTDHKTVGKYRRELEASGEIPQIEERTVTRDGTTYTQDTSNIGGGGDGSAGSSRPDLQARAERARKKADGAETPEDATSDLLDKAANVDGTPTPEREQKREERKDEYRERKQIEPFPEEGNYGVIYADPPWQYNNSGLDEYGHAERHYDTMGIDDLCELPVGRIAAEDCALYLWTTSPMLEDAFYVLSSWGFDYKTSYVWDKIAHNHGHYNSVRHELLLVATRGDGTPDRQKLYDSVVSIRRGDHSEKPPYFRRLLDVLYDARDKIELFAREEADVDRWDAWGDEI